ncbi:MAG: hypothetical protein MJZ40_01910 [Bacteroidaceae bacterium]|nr:hypothetical protein [Bacteroidaceae bacterium]
MKLIAERVRMSHYICNYDLRYELPQRGNLQPEPTPPQSAALTAPPRGSDTPSVLAN